MFNIRYRGDLPFKVLLVDDQRSIRDSIYALLESEGYDVLAAGSGAEALTILRRSSRPIRLLVTDFNMPHMSGLDLARECCRLSPELSVLYISGCQPSSELQADLAFTGRGFLAKPFLGTDLLRNAEELLRDSFTTPVSPRRLWQPVVSH